MKFLRLLTTKIWKTTKNAKIGVVWRVRGNPRSSKTSPFDTAHMTSYSTLIETMRLSCTVFELERVFCRKWRILTLIPFEFRRELWCQKTIVRRYLRDPTLSRFDTIPECDRQTDTQTHRHTKTAYTALSIASRGKKIIGYHSNVHFAIAKPMID